MNAALIIVIIILAVLYFVIHISGAAASSSESKLLQYQQQNQSFIAKLTGDNTIPPVNTIATGTTKFETKAPNNELSYEINLTNLQNDVARVDVHLGKKN
jgi:ABC-type transport system involved in cytochrome bd biosynthesis fused ATPase/permease subunit